MKSLLSFTLEHFLLFEATLLQYAYFTSAQVFTPSSNLSTCAGCAIAAQETIISYPRSVSETITSSSVTVVPFITVYENGNVTNYSTYSKFNSASSSDGIASAAPLLTWETLGTVLTYPTKYIAFPTVSAGTKGSSGVSCSQTYQQVKLLPSDQARLIFPSSSGIVVADVTNSAKSILDTIPAVTSVVAPFAPGKCTKAVGLSVFGTIGQTTQAVGETPAATASSIEAVVHTSVRYLTTPGQAIIVRSAGTSPPAQEQSPPPSNGGQGGNNNAGNSNDGNNNGGNNNDGNNNGGNNNDGNNNGGNNNDGNNNGDNNNSPQAPTITWGGSTYTGQSGGGWNFGGSTLTPGGPPAVIGGTTISVANGGSVVFNGQTTTASTPRSSGPALATGGAEGQVPVSAVTWLAGGAIGFLGMFVGVYL